MCVNDVLELFLFLHGNYYVFYGLVTLFFANNFLNAISDHNEIFTQFFIDHEVIFSSHIMFINAAT